MLSPAELATHDRIARGHIRLLRSILFGTPTSGYPLKPRRLSFVPILCALVFLCMAGLANAQDGSIIFYDLLDNITVYLSPEITIRGPSIINGTMFPATPNGITFSVMGETANVIWTSPANIVSIGGTNQRVNILEPPGDPDAGAISDTLFQAGGNPTSTTTFTSDTDGIPLPPLPPPALTLTEDGTIQGAATIMFHLAGGQTVNDRLFFQSDVVPEPSTFALMGFGIGLLLMRFRGRRA